MKNRKLYFGLSALILLFSVSIIALNGTHEKQTYSPRVSGELEMPRGIQAALTYLSKIRGNAVTGELNAEDVIFARTLADKFAKYKVGNAIGLNWEEMGPDNVGGRTRAILFDKRDATYNTLYAGGVAGGLWKSTDGGSNWNQVVLKDQNGAVDNTNLAISCITQAANGTIFVGTGEGLAQFTGTNFNSGQPGGGIYRCESGDDFKILANSTGFEEVNRLAVSANGTVYAATEAGLKYSRNYGNSNWKTVYKDQVASLNGRSTDVKIATDGTIVAVIDNNQTPGNNGNQCYIGTDSVFTSISTDAAFPKNLNSYNDRIEIAIAPSDPNYIYAVVADNGSLQGIYRSVNKGQNWTLIAPGGSTAFDLFGDNNQGWYDNVIAVFPNNPKKFVVGGIDCWKGEEYVSGAYYDFVQISDRNETVSATDLTPNPSYVHVDIHTLTFHPTNPNVFFVGSDGGVYKSANGGLSFSTLNRGYAVTQFYGLGVGPDGSLVGGTQDNSNPYVQGVLPYPKTAKVLWAGDGGWACISNITSSEPVKQKAIFVTAQNASMGRSYNNGADWQSKSGFFAPMMQSLQAAFVTPMVMWQTVTNTQIKDSVAFVADRKYLAGETIKMRSKQIGYPFYYTFGANLDSGNTIKVMDRALSRYYIGLYEGVWMTNEPLNFTKRPRWFKVAEVPGEVVQTLTYSQDGNHLFFTTGSKLYRISNLLNAADSAQLNCIDFSTSAANPNCVLTTTMINQFNGRTITSVAVDPRNPDNVVVTLGNFGSNTFIYASKNATSANPTFVNKTGNLQFPCYASLIEMNNDGMIFIGTEFGMYSASYPSFDNFYSSAVTWSPENQGMNRVPVFQIRQQCMSSTYQEATVYDNGNPSTTKYPAITNTGVIYIATHGRGFWQAKKFVGIPEITNNGRTDAKIDLSVYPNPVIDNANFKFNLNVADNVNINVYDLKGNLVKSLNLGRKAAGEQLYNFDASNLTKGTYIIQLLSGNQKTTSKFVKF